jgi:rod shape determining protein RodA
MSFLRNIDWKLQGSAFVLMGAGLLSLLSSSHDLFYKQLMWIAIGLAVFLFIVSIDLRSFFSHKGFVRGLYVISVMLLLVTYLVAPQIKGNRAWILIGGFQFQPSELAKLSLIILLAYFFSKRHVGIASWKTLIQSFIYFLIPGALIALQPDLGSAVMLFCIWFGFVLVSGIPLRRLAASFMFFLVAFAGLWTFVLKDYQKSRVIGVFTPQADPLGISYNVIQSKIAIGSGGMFGQGFGQGTQVQLKFLPEAQTDFIFSAIAEEGGVLAVALVVGCFVWLISRMLRVGYMLEGNFPKFLSLGVAILFSVQFIFNIGSTLGLLPVIGVTLPFVSYGGSSMIVNLAALAVIQSWYSRTKI